MASDAEMHSNNLYRADPTKPQPFQLGRPLRELNRDKRRGYIEDMRKTISNIADFLTYPYQVREIYSLPASAEETWQILMTWLKTKLDGNFDSDLDAIEAFRDVSQITLGEVETILRLLGMFRNYVQDTKFFFKQNEQAEPAILELPLEFIEMGWKILMQDGIVHSLFGPNRSGKSNLASHICRWLAKQGNIVVITNLAFFDTTLERYPNLHYTVFDSGMLTRIAQEKIKHGGHMKFFRMYDETDARFNTQNRQGAEIKNAGVFFKQMGKLGLSTCFIFKNERHIPPEFQRDRSKNKLPGGTVGYYLHMGGYAVMDQLYGQVDIQYYKHRWQRRTCVLLEDENGVCMPTIHGIPNEEGYYWHAMPCTSVQDVHWNKVMKDLQAVDLPRSNKPEVIDRWHRDLGYLVLERLPEWRLDGQGFETARMSTVLQFTNDYYERLISIGKGSWARASRKVADTYGVQMPGEALREAWTTWKEEVVAI